MPKTQEKASGSFAEMIATFNVPTGNALVTGADLRVDDCGTRLVIRTYTHVFELRGSATATIAELFASAPISQPAPSEMQGEAIAWAADGRGYFTTSEGTNAPLSYVGCR